MTETNKTFKNMVVTAVSKPSEYKDMIGIKKRIIVLYIFCAALVIGIIQVGVPAFAFLTSIGGPKFFISETLPAFELQDGVFHIDHKVDINESVVRIYADSDIERFKAEDVDDDKLVEALISKNNMLLVNRMTTQNYEVEFKDLGPDAYFDNQTLVAMLPFFYSSLAFGGFMAVLIIIVQYLYDTIFLAACGMIALMRSPNRPKFKHMILFAMMARLLPAILHAMAYTSGVAVLNSVPVGFAFTLAEFAMLWFAIKEYR